MTLKQINEFFDNLSSEEFESIALEAGLGEIEESPKLELDEETIKVIKDRKNRDIEEFGTGYIVDTMTPEKYNEILKDPNCGIILCRSEIPFQILRFLSLLRIEVYHNLSEDDIKSLQVIFSIREACDESVGDDVDIQ